jgi:hypothetical protein
MGKVMNMSKNIQRRHMANTSGPRSVLHVPLTTEQLKPKKQGVANAPPPKAAAKK